MQIFLIACFHVITAIFFLLLTLARMRQWRRWQVADTAAGASEPGAGGAASEGSGDVEPAKAAAAADGDAAELGRASRGGAAAPPGEPAGLGSADSSRLMAAKEGDRAPGAGGSVNGELAEPAAAEGLAKPSPGLITDIQKKWQRRYACLGAGALSACGCTRQPSPCRLLLH